MLPTRPTIRGREHVAASCHYLATQAAFEILENGGNAIDAGVAAGITLAVVEPEWVNFGGVAPIIIYLAGERRVVTVSGLGTWPKSIDPDFFNKNHGGRIPRGILRSVVPAAPDAWITALGRWGTMSFSDVTRRARGLASKGFVVDAIMAKLLGEHAPNISQDPASRAVYLPNGRVPVEGEVFVQSDLAATIQYMVDQEDAKRSDGRDAGLAAARDAFYRGDIAQRIARFQRENGGFLSEDDLAGYHSGIEPPVSINFSGIDVYACGPWCQGPSLLQCLKMLEKDDLAALGHNSAEYLHMLIESLKLAFADRERYYGDPRFVDVPIDALLSESYASIRRKLIRSGEAWPGLPPAGEPAELGIESRNKVAAVAPPRTAWRDPELDTSYACVVDRHGNAFSATPSDGTTYLTPMVPGLGIIASARGSQSWADQSHPSSVQPGKRPRLTPNPALAIREGEFVMPFGTPGGDVQTQAMLQAFLNIVVFGMDVQEAVDAPRFASFSFPGSFEPHDYHPGLLRMESRIPKSVGEALAAMGHKVEWWPEVTHSAAAVCAIRHDLKTGVISGGADPRRTSYALGW
jgi:gamma-glutamyltranspeptidase/glutathione hydrolase